MKRLLPMQSLLTLGTGNELKGLESCEEKLGGAVVGTMDGTFWVPCIITGWADGDGTMVKHGAKPCVDAFPDGYLFGVVHGGHFPTEVFLLRWKTQKDDLWGSTFLTRQRAGTLCLSGGGW